MKYLIIGKHGQLAKEFQRLLSAKGEEYIALTHEEADVRDYLKLREVFQSYKPSVVINCSAYNQVDQAESEYEEAMKVNTLGPYNLALLCREHCSFLVHYSTDYVFDGSKREGFYTETDEPNPINRYGLSKLLGERFASQVFDNMLLLRVSWVFGEGRQNFVYKVLSWAKEREQLQISADEVSVPTWARRIALVSYEAMREGLTGLYHLVSSGYASRYEWAKEVLKVCHKEKLVVPVSADVFDLPAKRPKFSAMSNEKISKELGRCIPSWEEDLREYLKEATYTYD